MNALFIVGLTLLGISFLWLIVAFALDWEKDYYSNETQAGFTETQFVGSRVRLQARFLWIWHFRGWAAGLAVLGLAVMTIAHPH